MVEIVVGILTSTPALLIFALLAPAARVVAWLGLAGAWQPFVRLVAVLAMWAALFFGGYRAADDRAELQTKIDALTTQLASANHQLAVQKLTADFASGLSAALQIQKTNAGNAAGDYKRQLNERTDACLIDAADVHARGRLRYRSAD
jgi:hypothetical protein